MTCMIIRSGRFVHHCCCHIVWLLSWQTFIVTSLLQDDEGADNLTDGDPDTFWESDGNQGLHWIRLQMKKGTIIKYVCLCNSCSHLTICLSYMHG